MPHAFLYYKVNEKIVAMLARCIIPIAILITGCAERGTLGGASAAMERGDYKTALHVLQPMAIEGVPEAQFKLGELYFNGEGVTRNYSEAAKWFRRSAESGFSPAQSHFGLMYYQGYGVTQDYGEAAKWLKLAAQQGDVDAAGLLGYLYGVGEGVPVNDLEGAHWDVFAAEHGNPSAQMRLGQRYREGRGVQQDYIAAYFWFELAAAEIGDGAIRSRDEVAKGMSPEQVSRAHQMANEWRAPAP